MFVFTFFAKLHMSNCLLFAGKINALRMLPSLGSTKSFKKVHGSVLAIEVDLADRKPSLVTARKIAELISNHKRLTVRHLQALSNIPKVWCTER